MAAEPATEPVSPATATPPAPVDLTTVAREWTRIGCVGFGGPPAHIVLLRELCVARRGWMTAQEFEDAVATTNLLPGPGSTQMALFCAWWVAGIRGALVGGAGFILPGLAAILLLAVVFLAGAPPDWIRGAGAGAGAAVAAVAVQAAWTLLRPGWMRVRGPARARWLGYLGAGAVAAAAAGPWTVVFLLACGAVELAFRAGSRPGDPPGPAPVVSRSSSTGAAVHGWPLLPAVIAAVTASGGLLAVAWVAFKVGALSYGGGFVVIPLMQADAVGHHHWMTETQFSSAVALGQVTPGPVTHTVAAVGYAAHGLVGALVAAVVAFTPSFSFIVLGAGRFDRLRADQRVRAFLDGAGPAAIGAILGAVVPLVAALQETWQLPVLAGAAVVLLLAGRGVVLTLLLAGGAGALVGVGGGPLPT
ncbi:putative chromate transport protein [Paraconexibacter sp. AEG42_29]|uniref:Chromate transport protein n=1 Tax=Paraconexibacter sp. AEG42_29 TaxID=2997339 RepID=A0AAU7AU25_9ACTN